MRRAAMLRRLRAVLLWGALGLALLLAAVEWLLPWLGRRGDLNAIVQEILRSSLTVPVTIEKVETEPFRELTVTRLRSVEARAEGRLRFAARAISVRYDPMDLIEGRIQSVVFDEPEVFLNLDADLASVARVPQVPVPPGAAAPPLAAGDDILPFSIETVTLERGSLTLRIAGRDLSLSRLRIETANVGRARGQRFQLSVGVLGGSVRAWGGLDVLREPGRPARYAVRGARVVIDEVNAAMLLEWLAGMEGAGSWLRAAMLRAAGTLQLEGSLEGVYPEEVEVSLATHAVDLSGAYAEALSLSGANVGVHLNATVLGDLETIRFTLSTHGTGVVSGEGGGRPEDASVEVEGELRLARGGGPATPEAGGTLAIAPSKAALSGLGELAFSGTVSSLLGEGPAAFDMAVRTGALDAGGAFSRLPASVREALARKTGIAGVAGELRGEARVTGHSLRPRLDGSFEVSGARVALGSSGALEGTLRGAFSGLETDARTGAIALERGELEASSLEARAIAALLGGGADLGAEGTVGVLAKANDERWPPGPGGLSFEGEVAWRGGGLAPSGAAAGATGVEVALSFGAALDPAARRLLLDARAEVKLREVLAGPFYASLEGEALRLESSGSVSWDDAGRPVAIAVERLEAETPVTGPVAARGSVARDSDGAGLRLEVEVQAPRIPGARAFRTLVAEPLAARAPFLEAATFEGQASLSLSAAGSLASPCLSGRIAVEPSALEAGRWRVEELELALPFEACTPRGGSAPRSGLFRARGIDGPSISLDSVEVPFTLDEGEYRLQPVKLRLHGGEVEAAGATFSLRGPGAPRGEVTLRARGLDARAIARAHGLPELDGQLELELAPLRLAGSRLESRGTVTLKAFGGEIGFSDLTVENVTKPYSGLRLREGRVRRVSLGAVGETFRFGVMSGILEGRVTDLELTGGELTRFELDLETVPSRGVPQFLNRAAIESIRRVLAGPLGALEETFFSRFYFEDFGFACGLKDGVFRLRGKHRDGEMEYLMRGRWYRLPRIDIVNGRPGRPYDWGSILEGLRQVYGRPASAGEEPAASEKPSAKER